MVDKPNHTAQEIKSIQDRLRVLDAERDVLVSRLNELQARKPAPSVAPKVLPSSRRVLAPEEKIALFRSLFRGREDVFPKRWESLKTGKSGYSPVCANEWVYGVCAKPRVKCGKCEKRSYLPVTDAVIKAHLTGVSPSPKEKGRDYTVGVYPLLPDESCWFLAADFDKESWQRDAMAFLETCRAKGVPATMERSRSGNGCHIWIFFKSPVPASQARRLGSLLLTATMDCQPEIGFESYDRFFPNQDTMPAGGFGNLIALPLQGRARQKANSVFVDDSFTPYPDQWSFLGSIGKMTPAQVDVLVEEAAQAGKILGVRLPLDEDEIQPWAAPPSRKKRIGVIEGTLPKTIAITLADQLYVDKDGVPPQLVNKIIRLAAFQNPEFYQAQAMRFSTFGKPRIVACAEHYPKHIGLPRGCLDDLLSLLGCLGIKPVIDEQRNPGIPLDVEFLGQLTQDQEMAFAALAGHETGVLVASTAFGKTVLAARLIAERKTNTLVLVHRRQLLDQWVARLKTFLGLEPKQIGQIVGGKKKPSGIVDIALIQSLIRKREVDDVVAGYGHLIVDECHHLSAISFEAVARRCKAKYVLGLTATSARKDGHHPIIFMQCGPVRFKDNPRKRAQARPFEHWVVRRETGFSMPGVDGDARPPIQEIYAAVAKDQGRNELILADVLKNLEEGRSPVVLSERKEHVASLAEMISRFARNVIVLQGGMHARKRMEILEQLASIPDTEERVLVATGRYLGEGFDDARLDTLFLAMPIAWRGTLAQYSGRLHRLHHAKREARVYDYVDAAVPMLQRMWRKREAGYYGIGYSIKENTP